MLVALPGQIRAQNPQAGREYSLRLRENILTNLDALTPVVFKSTSLGRYPWKMGIVTTIFWIGERPCSNNPVPNRKSSWDKDWSVNYGGFDNPDPLARRGYIPVNFVPRENPFYIALPYNDITRNGTKPEAYSVIPWFKQNFAQSGHTVLKDRWVAIRKGNRICYAQWEDCGPFRTDHWQYVFGNERPRPNLNRGAGLDVSPAVRDYLGLSDTDVTDWKFVEFEETPRGPWSIYGENNTFVQNSRKRADAVARNDNLVARSFFTTEE